MEYVLLMAGSITHAQRMAAVLENRGIRSFIARAPEGTDPRGCGYGAASVNCVSHRLQSVSRDFTARVQ